MIGPISVLDTVTDLTSDDKWDQASIYNNSNTTIYIGRSTDTLTTSNGFPIPAGAGAYLRNAGYLRGKLQAIAGASGGKDVRIWI